jgi:hypothetical protein
VYRIKKLKKWPRSTKLYSHKEMVALIRHEAEGSVVEMEERGYGSKAGAASFKRGREKRGTVAGEFLSKIIRERIRAEA